MKLTTQQVKQFLDDHYSDSCSNVIALTGGNWSQAFGFTRLDKEYVVRFGNHVADYHKDEVAAGFSSKALPIPKVLEIGNAFDAHFAISERAYGTMLDELNHEQMQKIIPAVLAMFDAMRKVELSDYDGYGPWDDNGHAPHKTWRDYLLQTGIDDPASRTHGWRAKLASSPIGDKAFNDGLAQLEKLAVFCPNEKHLIHTDLLNGNAMANDGKISAVFDWGNALVGDFLHDLACFSYWSKWYRTMDGIDWEAESQKHFESIGLEVPNFKERMLCYKLQISLDAQSYNAFTENWEHLEFNTNYMKELL